MNQPAQTSAPTLAVEFTGKTGEYFGIWIVNILLTIITLGIYYAWAKVRTYRYFYGNTLLAGSPFAYLANPVAILKGWAIAVAVLIVYDMVTNAFPLLSLVFFPLMLAALPWVIVRAMRFRARNTSWRNIQFGFGKAYGEAAKVYILYPFLMFITLGLFLPYYYYANSRFLVSNSRFGSSAFSFHATASDYYKIFLKPLLILLVIMGLVFAASYQTYKAYFDKVRAGIEASQTREQNSDESLYAKADELVDEQAVDTKNDDIQPENPDAAYSEAGVDMESSNTDPRQQSLDEHDEKMQQALQDLATANDNIEYADAGMDEMEGSGDEEYASEMDALAAQQAQEDLNNTTDVEETSDTVAVSPVVKVAGFIGAALLLLLTLLFYLALIAYIQSRTWNLLYNNTQLAGNRFISTVRARDLAWLYASNIIMISITFGLMIPWAKIRLARYRASKLLLVPAGNLDNFIQAEQEKISALGEELGDVFDLDIGI